MTGPVRVKYSNSVMDASFLERPMGNKLAYILTPGQGKGACLPAVMFCTGFRSDMGGTKAVFLETACRERGQAFLRFDYSGHGQSGGQFEACVLSTWIADARDMMDVLISKLSPPGVILVGSSMGGWVALSLALARKDRVCGLVGIAAAPDFTKNISLALTSEQKTSLQVDGLIRTPNPYSDKPYVITRALLDDGNTQCVLNQSIDLDIPVRLIHGMQDSEVPWQTAWRIRNALTRPGLADVILVEQGDHRLSRPEDLLLIDRHIAHISGVCI